MVEHLKDSNLTKAVDNKFDVSIVRVYDNTPQTGISRHLDLERTVCFDGIHDYIMLMLYCI